MSREAEHEYCEWVDTQPPPFTDMEGAAHDGFVAGFTAGQVAALEEAADWTRECPCSPECEIQRPHFVGSQRELLRARAAELSKETP